MSSTLGDWGWGPHWAGKLAGLAAGGAPARVVGQDRGRWTVQTEAGPGAARLASTKRIEPYPAVGDWVAVEPGPRSGDPHSVVAVLPRRSVFRRAAAGGGRVDQALAANIDVVWLVHGLDAPLNPRRLERYLALAWESGAEPVIVLTKADLAPDPESVRAEVGGVALGVAARIVAAGDAAAIEALRGTLAAGCTVALLGPSGVGKSTLVNALAGAALARTGAVREDDRKGRHTTTRRELFRLPGGGLLLDTPGLRELGVWELGEGLQQTFPDIDALASECRFRDCRHEQEPGCAVLAAASTGGLDSDRLASFRKLRAEAANAARRADPRARRAAISEHKTALKTLKHHIKRRDPT